MRVVHSMRLLATLFLLVGSALPARAEGFISPYLGYDFGGDAACPNLTGCQDKKLNVGVGFGSLGKIFGFEEELGYAKNFFGEAPGLDSSVLTLLSNLMLAPALGPVHPYLLGGAGLIKTHVALTPPGALISSDNNNLGWDLGGGAIVFFGAHVGVRGDIRHIHSFQNLSVLGFTLSSTKLDFGRASAALVLKF